MIHRRQYNPTPRPTGGIFNLGSPEFFQLGICNQTDPEAFFPDKGASVKEAKAVCFACPVREQCLQWAIDNGEWHGIWGGTATKERRKLAAQAAAS